MRHRIQALDPQGEARGFVKKEEVCVRSTGRIDSGIGANGSHRTIAVTHQSEDLACVLPRLRLETEFVDEAVEQHRAAGRPKGIND